MNTKITHFKELPLSNINLPESITQSDILNKILTEVYNGWPGQTGLERVKNVIEFISSRIPQYAKAINKSELEMLEILATKRTVNYTNYFQNHYIPDIDKVLIFDSVEDFKKQYPSGKYVCPACSGISTDYQECNSGTIVDKKTKEICNWKVYGLLGDLGKGIRVLIRDKFTDFPKPIHMFKPIEHQ